MTATIATGKQGAEAHSRAAMGALARGDLAAAESELVQAVGVAPGYLPGWLNLAAVRRQRGDLDGAFDAIRKVLTLDPRNFAALLMSGTMLEREGRAVPAALAYGAALVNAPPEERLDATTRRALERAREVHASYTGRLDEHVRRSVAAQEDRCTGAERRRLDAFIRTTLRVERRYQQEPTEYYYPGLPAIEFYERSEVPWVTELEDATEEVRRELLEALAGHREGFEPYIHYGEHLPLEQWRELNHSPRWTSYEFYRQGEPIGERCARAPATMEAVTSLPQARVPKRSPCAMYSALQPHTRIPPHTGIANFRLVVHLPLIVPDRCGFRVGSETRSWRPGEAWVFDDTIEHEAWNESDEPRYILICDVWNPRLSEEERAAIAAVIAATDVFNGTTPPDTI